MKKGTGSESKWFLFIESLRGLMHQWQNQFRSNIYLESVEEYSKEKIHKSEPEPGNGNVNTVYFVNQARGNQIHNRTEFVYDEQPRDCKCLYI